MNQDGWTQSFLALVARLSDASAEVRRDAARELGPLARERADAIDSAITALLPLLCDPCYPVRAAACESLGGFGPSHANRTLAPLLDALVEPRPDGDFFMSISAIVAVAHLAPASVPRLAEMVENHPDMRFRAAAATALGEAGPIARDAAPALRRAREKGSELVSLRSAAALVAMGYPEDGMPILLRALSDGPPPLRMQAAFILGRLPVTRAEAIEGLARALDDEVPRVRAQAIESLARSGEAARPYAARIEACLRDPDDLVRTQAARAREALDQAERTRLVVTEGIHKPLPGVSSPGPAATPPTGDGQATTGSNPIGPSRRR